MKKLKFLFFNILGYNVESSSDLKGIDRQDTVLLLGNVPVINESDYNDINNENFRIFNDIRSNPEKYEHTLDSRLRNTLRKITEERVDTILFSNRFYEIAFDYLISLNDKNAPTSQIYNFLQNEINSYAREDEKYERGLGIGDWANPQSPIPNPQSPIRTVTLY
jgi:hypothetical protein